MRDLCRDGAVGHMNRNRGNRVVPELHSCPAPARSNEGADGAGSPSRCAPQGSRAPHHNVIPIAFQASVHAQHFILRRVPVGTLRAELPEFSAIACSDCARARFQNHVRAVNIYSTCASARNIGLSGCGRHPIRVPSAAVRHISSEAEMPPTSMNDGLSLTAPAQAPQRRTNHAAGTPAILAVISLSFSAPRSTKPVPAARKLCRRIGGQAAHGGDNTRGCCNDRPIA